jgi:hypothetical protein
MPSPRSSGARQRGTLECKRVFSKRLFGYGERTLDVVARIFLKMFFAFEYGESTLDVVARNTSAATGARGLRKPQKKPKTGRRDRCTGLPRGGLKLTRTRGVDAYFEVQLEKGAHNTIVARGARRDELTQLVPRRGHR